MSNKQNHKLTIQKSGRTLAPIYILLCLALLAVIGMIIAISIGGDKEQSEFVPPEFDAAAVKGIPDVPDDLGYSSPYQEGMAYKFSVCGKISADDVATVYFTSDEENDVYLKLRILDEKGNILGECGLIRGGEYVKEIRLSRELKAGEKIKLKVMGYEVDTYYSAGSVVLSTVIG